ncbi:DHA2 family efflux MFS transporter permease subunit [Actinocrinis puniceicyclus]|nr:DHA2 family efflux MFS transporter permease subunit [Actinocrinis puniceicyclus]
MTTARKARPTRLVAVGGTFLAMLDSTVVNLALPTLHRRFPTESISTLSWVVTAYVVMFAAMLAPAGRIADALGRRIVFLGGVGLFSAMSLAAALAPNLGFLIAARTLQGIGAAAMVPAALAILLLDGPAEQRARAIGFWSAASAAAAALGPPVGGALVDAFGWESVFYVNLPFGAAMIYGGVRSLPRPPRAQHSIRSRMPDPVGTVLLAAGTAALTLGVTQGPSWHWTSPGTLAALIGGAGAIVAALLYTSRTRVPAVDTSLWRIRTFAVTNIVSVFYGMAQYPWLLVGVLYVSTVWHYSPLQAGLAMTPGAVTAAITALGLGKRLAVLGPRRVLLFGLVAIVACGVWLVLGLTQQPRFLALWLPAGLLVGVGMGATTLATSATAALSAPPVAFATASGVNTMARQFGGALGIAVAAAVLQTMDGARAQAYERVYVYCTAFVVVAFLITLWRMRIPAPPQATMTQHPAGESREQVADSR